MELGPNISLTLALGIGHFLKHVRNKAAGFKAEFPGFQVESCCGHLSHLSSPDVKLKQDPG